MMDCEKIERYVDDLLTVMGIDKDGEEQLLWLFLHHACCAAAIYEVLGDDMKPVYTEMLKKLNYFFSSKISVKQRKRRKEKENFPPYPLLKEKDKKEKGEKNIYTHTAVGETGIVFSELDQRREAFKMECWARRDRYDRELLANFFNYWSDVNPKTHKMRFEDRNTGTLIVVCHAGRTTATLLPMKPQPSAWKRRRQGRCRSKPQLNRHRPLPLSASRRMLSARRRPRRASRRRCSPRSTSRRIQTL